MRAAGMDDARDERRLTLALFAVAWGANQFTPLLLVYRQRFGFGPAVLGASLGLLRGGARPGAAAGRGRLGRARPPAGGGSVLLPLAARHRRAHRRRAVEPGPGAREAGGRRRLRAWCSARVRRGWWSSRAALHTRRAALAVTAGFCLGPLAAGLVADALPWPAVLPYLPHLVLMAVALPGVISARETLRPGTQARRAPPSLEVRRRFQRGVAPVAPFVFASVAVAFVVLPTRFPPLPHPVALVGPDDRRDAGHRRGDPVARATAGGGTTWTRRGGRARRRHAGAGGGGVDARAPDAARRARRRWASSGAPTGCVSSAGSRRPGRLADAETRGTLVGWFYAWAYLGFAAPFVIAWLTPAASTCRGCSSAEAPSQRCRR